MLVKRSRLLLFISTILFEQTYFFDASLQEIYYNRVVLNSNENLRQYLVGGRVLQTVQLKEKKTSFKYKESSRYADFFGLKTVTTDANGWPVDKINHELLLVEGSVMTVSSCEQRCDTTTVRTDSPV